VAKNDEATENGQIFQLVSINVFNVLSRTSELHMQHNKPLQARLVSAVCVCAVLAF
jgi:hypothetical protein